MKTVFRESAALTALVLYFPIVTLSLGLLLVVGDDDDGDDIVSTPSIILPVRYEHCMGGTDRSHCVGLILIVLMHTVLLLARRQPSCNCLSL